MQANWPAWLWLLVSALAVYRLTLLVTEDYITSFIRDRVMELGEPWATGIQCPWCVSIWASTGAVLLYWLSPDLWQILAEVLAFSAIAGWLGSRE